MGEERSINFIWLNKPLTLKIAWDLYAGEELSDNQKNAADMFEQNFESILSDSLEKFQNFAKNNYGEEITAENFWQFITPKNIYIKQSGRYGILCNSSLEPEHGLAFIFKDDVLEEINLQDYIL